MSTRCHIVIDGSHEKNDQGLYPVYIYKHCNGYPEGVLPVLKPIVQHCWKERGFDPFYLTAQIVRAFAFAALGHQLGLGAGNPLKIDCTNDMFGWGLGTELHTDVEFIYHITNAGGIIVRDPKWNTDRNVRDMPFYTENKDD